MMETIIRAALGRARTMFGLLALLLVAGTASYLTIPKEANPDIPIPVVYVSMTQTGISPEDAVNLLIKPMEKELRALEGLDEMEATAYEGGANVVLTFQAGLDVDQSLTDVREKVDIAKAKLPQEAEEPRVSEVNFSLFPILTIILGGDLPEWELKTLAEDLQDRLESLPGVLEANIGGLRQEMVLIEVDRTRLESYAISPQEIASAVSSNNQLVAAGSMQLENGNYAIKVPGLFRNADEILALPLRTDGDHTVRVGDVAQVKLAFKDASTQTRVNGKPAVTLEIVKRVGKNVIETVDAVKTAVAAEQVAREWPETLAVSYTGDESEGIRTMLADLQNNVIMAILLVMVVILMALGARPALLVAIAIPGSMLTAILLLSTAGFTANVVVLFALILSVGMLVDGAVVVTENAETRRAQGESRDDAFAHASVMMSWPIIASTLTTLAAFMPLLFWPDIVGEFMKFMPLTLIFTLTASLFMALIFLPVIGSNTPAGKAVALEDAKLPFTNRYEGVLRWSLARPRKILLATALSFVGMIFLYGQLGRGVEFFPRIEPERASLVVHAKGDMSLAQKDAVMRLVEDRVLDLAGVETVYTVAGEPLGSDTGPGDTIGQVMFSYIDWQDGRPTSEEILAEAFKRTADIPGVRVERQEDREGPQSGKPIQVLVTSQDYRVLVPVIEEIQAKLEEVSGVINVSNNLPQPGIEWAVNIDRVEAAKAGTSLAEVGLLLRFAATGAEIGEYRAPTKREELDIVARFPEEQRMLGALQSMRLGTVDGQTPISNFAEVKAVPKVDVIRRQDQQSAAKVEADVLPGVLASEIIAGMQAYLEEQTLPPGVEIVFKGDQESQQESQAFLMNAFMVSLFVMALILVTQFNNVYQAGIILSAVIFSTIGVFLGHIVMMKPFGVVMSGLGVIALAGIVVNNNIVLIDTYNKIKHDYDDFMEAIIQTGVQRLRPVLLTAVTTIVGLLPMGLKINIDLINRTIIYNAPSSQWWDQLANSIMFGLAVATVLTLVVTPCMLALQRPKKK